MIRMLLFTLLLLPFLPPAALAADTDALTAQIVARHPHPTPTQWGERLPGIVTRLATSDKVIALTFDACGGPKGSGVDERLLAFLEQERIPATLFINGRWIAANRERFAQLASVPWFEIANHGQNHQPASVSGRSAYHIKGTASVAELVDEVAHNARTIERLTGQAPRFFRAGTAYYDEVAVAIIGELGETAAGYSVLGDAGATYSAQQVEQALRAARPGDIVLLHMNHPTSGTAAGVIAAVPQLREAGYRFVRLSDLPLR